MDALLHLIQNYGLWVVFVAVLLDQGGLPVPAFPPIIVASAMAVEAQQPLWPIVLVAALAALLADGLWYAGGRRFGAHLVRLMCRMSLSPDSCVATTRDTYARWGAPSLVVAKFIPGFAALATTLAGQTRTGLLRFALYDGLGAALWALVAVGTGALFHDAVNDVLAQLEALGHVGVLALLSAIALFVAYKWWKRQRFIRLIRMARITVPELQQLFDEGTAPLVLDVRPSVQREASGWIPGAVRATHVRELDVEPQHEVIVYCDCPNEASAAKLARELQQRGFKRVRPLAGGFEAWHAQGMPVERTMA
ncbi:rhodanese-like domain-containing protein [Aerolutibacter ruishenii]|uniref:Membrane protein DedA with SNARE-associated domain n=1 Tax=Aerolutibacter ruishenii TaxID=686800 RepID=A0A562LI41_9GAMM|nr:VTT domain-containing protein [Lysobacter ruishenii]TWI07304.1 membrane protein DedA with SNARE-associated domain [Lysobacter ruishenii]